MGFLTQTEKQALRDQLQQAENATTGEIVTVIADQSDGYRFIPLLWAALISLSTPGLVFLYQHLTASDWQYPTDSAVDFASLYPIQVMLFLGLGSLFQWTPIRLMLIPKSVKLERVQRHANEQFFKQGLHLTQNNNGVLIFVSVAEHYVQIIVDRAVVDSVDNAVWQQSVDEFIQHVRKGDIAEGFTQSVEHCRTVLNKHFPAPEDNTYDNVDELTNHLIEIYHQR